MKKDIRLPSGSATEWDMGTLTLEQLEYERELCRQILYGVWLPEYNTGLDGMLNQLDRAGNPIFDEALRVWKLRFRRANDELVERGLFSDPTNP